MTHGAALAKKGGAGAGRDIHDARRVARKWLSSLCAPITRTPREAVIDEFADSYLAVRRCALHSLQRAVKVQRPFEHRARNLDADCMANGITFSARWGAEGAGICMSQVDRCRDQSYFLFSTNGRAARYLPLLWALEEQVQKP